MGALKLETLAATAEPTEAAALQPVAAVALMGVELRHFPLDALYIGGNYRTAMSAPGLEELTESIRHSGLIQPITVRPLAEPVEGKHFALVAGARRYAAHQLAGLPTILCNVREMNERQAEEARLIENVQRENPHPADEAVAVGKLSKYGATFQEIASRLGKSLRWVAQRKAVSQLVGPWLRALRADKLTLAAAEELARWPQAVQARLVEENHQTQRATPLSESAVKYWLQSEMHLLSAAPWSLHDADLYPQAGACGTCPKRSGCAGVLFERPGKGKDACLDKGCWGVKLARRTARAIQENSTDEQPAYRLSSRSYETPAGALPPGRYEVSKQKKGTVAGVFIDGPQQSHAVRILLAGLPAAPAKSPQEAQHEARRQRLTQQATKSVLAGRIVVLLGQPDEEGEQVRRVLLGEAITERLLFHRTALDELVLAHLVRDWKWPVVPEKTRKALRGDEYRQWVRAQVAATAPTEAGLTRLLLYVLVHHDLSNAYNDQQQQVAGLLNRPELTQGLAEAAQERLFQQHDPLTLRARR